MKMIQTWRWYGPTDPVTLTDIRQTGATGIVTALHHIPNGEVWPVEEIQKRKKVIEDSGLIWSVVESLPIHESIKTQSGDYKRHIENYKQSMINLSVCGTKVICYNFMPILDWTRTALYYTVADGSKALAFTFNALIVFDVYLLKRPDAERSYSPTQLEKAAVYYNTLTEHDKWDLVKTIIAGLPGSSEGYPVPEDGYDLTKFQTILNTYEGIGEEGMRHSLISFLEAIIPTAEAQGLLMCIHPDDPPFSILGLPRIMGVEKDYDYIFSKVPSLHNGITFCTGSLGVRADNDLVHLFTKFADRVHFLHLRSTKRDEEGNFFEADHLDGDVDMYGMVKSILIEQKRRVAEGRTDFAIPMRPDHGHLMLDDMHKKTNPGYSAIGRMRGLAELRGLELGILKGLD
jgi:mannonate dehydratase